MAIAKIEKSGWGAYFERLSKALAGQRAEIEVDSLRLGAGVEAAWLPLLGITYDARSDMVDIALEGIDHAVRHPREVYVDQDGVVVSSVELIDASDERSIVKLREPVRLPPAKTGGPVL